MTGPMTPLQKIAMGLVIVALDTLGTYDLLPDFIGWLLVLWGLASLPLPERGRLTAVAAIAGAVSLALWFPQVKDQLADAELSLKWATSLPDLAFIFLTCRALERAARSATPRDVKFVSRFGITAWATVVIAVLPPIAYAADSDTVLGYADVSFVLLWLWLIWNLFAAHDRDYAKPPAATTATGGS